MPNYLTTYDCPECGLSIDRDLNASINLIKRVRNSEVSSECKMHSRDAVSESYTSPSVFSASVAKQTTVNLRG
ncbi:MAG: transposase [Okeania sp. SIO2F4]|nr:transposase [Okeania sp. SIO2F4]